MSNQIIKANFPTPHIITFCLLILCFVLPAATVCPASAPYLLSANNQCYAICPWEAPNKYYAYSVTSSCELVCPGAYYGFDGNKTCTTTCPSAPIQTFYDTVNKRCVNTCPANYFGYIGSVTASNQKCVQSNNNLKYRLPKPNIFRLQ